MEYGGEDEFGYDLTYGAMLKRARREREERERLAAQHLSGLADARKERVADGDVSEYGEGATELMTQQTQPAGAEFSAPQENRHTRQEGAE